MMNDYGYINEERGVKRGALSKEGAPFQEYTNIHQLHEPPAQEA